MPIDQLQTLMMNDSFEIEIDTFYNYYEIGYSMSGFLYNSRGIPESRCHISHLKAKYFEVCRNRYLKSSDCEAISNYGGSYSYYSIHQFENFLKKIKDEVACTQYDFDQLKVLRVNKKYTQNKKKSLLIW